MGTNLFYFFARFDGDGMTHGVRVSKGKAYYTNKFVKTEKFELEKKV